MTVKKKRILKFTLLLVLLIAVAGGFTGYKMWTKPHRNVEAAASIQVPAAQLAVAYETNEPFANSQYLDKVLEVSGTIDNISKNQKGEPVITLKGSDMSGIICTLEGAVPATITTGAPVTIKGICTGYLTDVVLVRCIVQAK
ncbi:OB-fold protein [Ferruginibacter profundus]